MATLRLKRGDTLRVLGRHADRGVAVPLFGAAVAAAMTDGQTALPMTCRILDAATGLFECTMPAVETAELAPGFYEADVEFTHSGGGVISTQTFGIEILEDITGVA
jgi:hypothetical protein